MARTVEEQISFLAKLPQDEPLLMDYFGVDEILEMTGGAVDDEDAEWFDGLPEKLQREFGAQVIKSYGDYPEFPTYEHVCDTILKEFKKFKDKNPKYKLWLEEAQ